MVWLARYAPEARAAMVVRSNCSESPPWVIRKPPLSMTRADVASLSWINWRRTRSSSWMSSSMSWGSVAIAFLGGLGRALRDELVQQHAGDHVERFKNPVALVGDRVEGGHLEVAVVQQEFHVFHRGDV